MSAAKRQRNSSRIPQYRLHKRSGLARVRLNGRDIYLGKHGSPASHEKYDRIVAEWLSSGRATAGNTPASHRRLTVIEMLAAYWKHVRVYYVDKAGEPTSEQNTIKNALRPVKTLYGSTAAEDFGPRCLVVVRDEMIRKGLARRHINKQISRVRSAFSWAAANELISATVPEALRLVPPLRQGRTSARETEKIRPVPTGHVRAIRPFVSRQVFAIVRLQLLTAARAGELVRLRANELDQSDRVWKVVLAQHKTAHHSRSRTLYFGPRSQRILRRFLDERDSDAYLFSPREAERERHDRAATHRRQDQRPNLKETTRVVGDCYCTSSYRRAIHRACVEAGIPKWSPHQLRHVAATLLRKEQGLDTAQVVLGHANVATTLAYAEADEAKAIRAMAAMG